MKWVQPPSFGRTHSLAGSVGTWLTSSLLPCHTASCLLLPVWGTQPAAEALATSSKKRQFHNERGSFAKWGVLEPSHNCASALSQPHTCSCNGSAVICSLPLCMFYPSAPGVSIDSPALLQSLAFLSLPAACGRAQICPGIAVGPLGRLYWT